jgi:hypothetical protein
MKDGEVLAADPKGLVAYTPVPFREWSADVPFS